ncbi:helix-turn-helix transcriptional regulator [Nonomuraea polychroma]|uniref:helix-turn-helix transcriptional regulator n=1 Tax=Nonomuraea polychroma TaxID=46176 RepID=UPI003BAA20A0
MPVRSRLHAEAFTVLSARNYWEFPAPPIDAEIIRAVGSAINRQHLVRVDYTGDGEPVTLTLEPHDLVVWAARWYMVAFDPDADRWRAMRVDRIKPHMPTHTPFDRRDIPHGDPAAFSHDRTRPRRRRRRMAMPWLSHRRAARLHRRPVPPGGSTVGYVTETTCRLTTRRMVMARTGRTAPHLRRRHHRHRTGRTQASPALPAHPNHQGTPTRPTSPVTCTSGVRVPNQPLTCLTSQPVFSAAPYRSEWTHATEVDRAHLPYGRLVRETGVKDGGSELVCSVRGSSGLNSQLRTGAATASVS